MPFICQNFQRFIKVSHGFTNCHPLLPQFRAGCVSGWSCSTGLGQRSRLGSIIQGAVPTLVMGSMSATVEKNNVWKASGSGCNWAFWAENRDESLRDYPMSEACVGTRYIPLFLWCKHFVSHSVHPRRIFASRCQCGPDWLTELHGEGWMEAEVGCQWCQWFEDVSGQKSMVPTGTLCLACVCMYMCICVYVYMTVYGLNILQTGDLINWSTATGKRDSCPTTWHGHTMATKITSPHHFKFS